MGMPGHHPCPWSIPPAHRYRPPSPSVILLASSREATSGSGWHARRVLQKAPAAGSPKLLRRFGRHVGGHHHSLKALAQRRGRVTCCYISLRAQAARLQKQSRWQALAKHSGLWSRWPPSRSKACQLQCFCSFIPSRSRDLTSTQQDKKNRVVMTSIIISLQFWLQAPFNSWRLYCL